MSDTAVLEEIHVNLSQRRLGLAERQETFRRAWQQQDEVADLPTVRMPRITADLGGDIHRTVKLSTAELEIQPLALVEARIAHEYRAEITQAICTFVELTGRAPDIALCWAMDLLLMGAPDHLSIETDIGLVDVRLVTESELLHHVHQDGIIICDARGK